MLSDYLEHLYEPWVLIYLLLVVTCVYNLYYIWTRFFSRQGIPKHFPWAGPKSGILRRARASCRSFLGLRELLIDGYENYSKAGRAFVLPNIVTGHEVILPPSQMQWILNQPDNVLSQHEANKQFLCAEYTMLHPSIIGESRMANFIYQHLTRDLDVFAKAIVDEIEYSLEDYWGTESLEWKEFDLYNTMLIIIGRLVNRVLVGESLTRDPKYLWSSIKFAQVAPVTGGMISLLPGFLKPLLGPLVTSYDSYHYRRMARKIKPIVKQRLATLESPLGLKKHYKSEHNDYIQWALNEAFAHGEDPKHMPDMISKRLAVLGFAAIQSSALTITNTLLDIAASSESITIQKALRAEAQTNLDRRDGKTWTRESLTAMYVTDSTLRESLRLWSFVSHGVTKAVVAPGGVTLPSGEHLPQGAKVGIASYGPQHDDKVYPSPYIFDAFRFCAISDTQPAPVKRSLVTTDSHFMGFSHGKHACPGRFFASQQLKLLLAIISLRYDIKPITQRPRNEWLNNTIGPDVWATLKVRRRRNIFDSYCGRAAAADAAFAARGIIGVGIGTRESSPDADTERITYRTSEKSFGGIPIALQRTPSEQVRDRC